MNLKKVNDIFDEFEFNLHEQVCHKANNEKLFILSRAIVEAKDANNNSFFERIYTCRVKSNNNNGMMEFFEYELIDVRCKVCGGLGI